MLNMPVRWSEKEGKEARESKEQVLRTFPCVHIRIKAFVKYVKGFIVLVFQQDSLFQ